jgi:23S rRNA U2552 (ribose-2'-O)-methylase RlmE/FtsJ
MSFIYTVDEPVITLGFESKLNLYRNKISKKTQDEWKKCRYNINLYDFPLLKSIHVINRAFYKYWEIIHEFGIFENFQQTDSIFHIAEAPGGFIQASNYYLKNFTNLNNCSIYTMSINKSGNSYNNSVLKQNVRILYGHDGTGDICNIDNTLHLKIRNVQIITADGGFDEKLQFNYKEQLHCRLIFNEILSSIILQKKEGVFVLKIFDIYTNTSLHLMYLLKTLYKEFYIYKPITSRPTNSEKYVICKNFKGVSTEQLKILIQLSKNMSNESFRLFSDIPQDFIEYIKTFNKKYISNQCNYILKAMSDDSKTDLFTPEQRRLAFYRWRLTYLL